jgi:hypothetical protein
VNARFGRRQILEVQVPKLAPLLGVILALGAGLLLRAALRNDYDPTLDWGVRLNWARRIVEATELGPLTAVGAAALRGDADRVFALLAGRQGSLLFALASGAYLYPTEFVRFGSAALMALGLEITGYSLGAAKLLAIAADLVGVALVYPLSRALRLSRTTAVVLVAILSLLAAKALFSVQAFYHLFGAAATTVCLLAFARALRSLPAASVRVWLGVGVLFGLSMYVNWFLQQLAFVASLIALLARGFEEGCLRRALRCGIAMAAAATATTLPAILHAGLHWSARGWSPTSDYGAAAEAMSLSNGFERIAAYASGAAEYFTLPLLFAALLGGIVIARDRATRPAFWLFGSWLAMHAAFFGLTSDLGVRFMRPFQIVELPVALWAACGIAALGRALARRLTGTRGRGPHAAAAAAVATALVLLAALAPNLHRDLSLLRGRSDIADSMPRFHNEYPRTREVMELCDDLAAVLPAGSNVLAYSWQLLEAVCPAASRWQMVNLHGFCRIPDERERRQWLATRFPRYRADAPHLVILERRYETDVAGQEHCLEQVASFAVLGPGRVELEGRDAPEAFYARALLLEPRPTSATTSER